jgi:mRNA interferase MazF
MEINRGGVFLTKLAQPDAQVTKTRPVLVISNDIANQHSGTVTVLPVTSRNLAKVYPFEIMLPQGAGNLSKASKVKTDQIRTIDRSKILKFVGAIEEKTMMEIEKALKIHLAL